MTNPLVYGAQGALLFVKAKMDRGAFSAPCQEHEGFQSYHRLFSCKNTEMYGDEIDKNVSRTFLSDTFVRFLLVCAANKTDQDRNSGGLYRVRAIPLVVKRA
jgi:hypothetical protein